MQHFLVSLHDDLVQDLEQILIVMDNCNYRGEKWILDVALPGMEYLGYDDNMGISEAPVNLESGYHDHYTTGSCMSWTTSHMDCNCRQQE